MYDEMYEYVKRFLADNDHATKTSPFPFRTRSDHIWRVFHWAKRLITDNSFDVAIDKESVLIAALFHDVGYSLPLEDAHHAENSVVIFNQYASEKNFDPKRKEFISYLIGNHSNKYLLDADDTPLELIILMEADLLDETGALSIVWDCMMEGGQEEQSFLKTYKHIKGYSYKALEKNPMKTEKAKEIWINKQNFVREFLKHLEVDLVIHES